MVGIYWLGIQLYGLFIALLSPFNKKARLFYQGRKKWKSTLQAQFHHENAKIVWFHAASLGEFEQGRPVMEELRKSHPSIKILLTFFSPSGYEIRKNYNGADWVLYLPLDSPSNARYFVETVNPTVAVFIKYEFWYYYLKTLTDKKTPTIYISCIFRENQWYFKNTGRFFRPVLQQITHFFFQNTSSQQLGERIGISRSTVAGDTRFDRVLSIANEAQSIEQVEAFKANEDLMVIGSCWASDMEKIGDYIRKNCTSIKFAIAPHNLHESEIQALEQSFEKAIRFSQVDLATVASYRVLIIDNMGMLSSLYRYGHWAYVGGGFRGALHNTLEAAVYGIPVVFGDHANNQKFQEAIALVECGGAFAVTNAEDFEEVMNKLQQEDVRADVGKKAGEYVRAHTGATPMIIEKLNELLPA